MAELVGAVGTSHIPAVGVAIDKGRMEDPYWAPYFAKLPPPAPPAQAADAALAERAKAAIRKHHCASCHNADFSGRDQMPRLAAQREDYLLKALRDYKAQTRPGYEPTMDEVMRPVTDTEIADLAHYLSRLR